MAESYTNERLVFFDQLLKDKKNFLAGRFWALEPERLRFKHGESISELKVPYHLGKEDEEIIENALNGLLALLKRRFEAPSKEGAMDAHFTDEIAQQSLRERTCRLDLLPLGSLERRVAEETLDISPSMDGVILSSWLTGDGSGRKFLQWVDSLMEKALKEESSAEMGEKTSYLAFIAIVISIRKKRERLKDFRIRGISYEKLDFAVGFTIYTAFRCALWALFERLEQKKLPYYSISSEVILKTALEPFLFLAIPANLLSTSLNPYGITKDVFDAIVAFLPKMEDANDLGSLMKTLKEKVKDNPLMVSALELQHGISRWRAMTMDYLKNFDVPGIEGHRVLYEIFQEDRLIKNLLADSAMSENVTSLMEEIKGRYRREVKRVDAIEAITNFLSTFHKGKFKLFKKPKIEEKEDFVDMALRDFIACWFDSYIERFTAPIRLYLVDRRESYDTSMLMDEYNRGRLYRFSVDARPVLKSLEVEAEGQLFIDMKDFTRKTLRVKEIAMAEFMKDNFYGPILDCATRHGMGDNILEGGGWIRLNSLPGDAAIFSGSVERLVMLARDIQRVIRQYREKLSMRLPPAKDELLLEGVHKRFESRSIELKGKKADAEKALERGDEKAGKIFILIAEEEHRLEKVYRDELKTAITTEMEAGLFISYGAKPETMRIETKDADYGTVRVSIGEKIIEAARGTTRNSSVRAKLEMMLEKERVKRNAMHLRYPFDVYIDKTYVISIPPELHVVMDAMLAQKKDMDVKALTTWVAKEFYNDLMKLSHGAPLGEMRVVESMADIYNKGEAMSEEALMAYMKETRRNKFFFKKIIPVGSLNRSIREDCYFPNEELEFWFDYEVRDEEEFIEGFLRIGEVVFKGFELLKPTVVYEILNPDGEFFRTLKKHHLKEWIEEAKAKRVKEG